jgi:hypothetical protein
MISLEVGLVSGELSSLGSSLGQKCWKQVKNMGGWERADIYQLVRISVACVCWGRTGGYATMSLLLGQRHRVTRIFHCQKDTIGLAIRGFWNALAASHLLR